MPTEKSQVQQGSATTKQSNAAAGFDRDLDDLPADLRWRAWMQRVEAVIFASAAPVPREDLAQVVGQDAHIDLLIGDIQSELQSRPYELVATSNGWMFRTRPEYSDAIRMAADVGQQVLDLSEAEIAVLAAIALHQPLSRSGLKDIFGKDISRDLINRLRQQDLVATGPRSPRPGAPFTFVTTPRFLTTFGMESLRDLPDPEEAF